MITVTEADDDSSAQEDTDASQSNTFCGSFFTALVVPCSSVFIERPIQLCCSSRWNTYDYSVAIRFCSKIIPGRPVSSGHQWYYFILIKVYLTRHVNLVDPVLDP